MVLVKALALSLLLGWPVWVKEPRFVAKSIHLELDGLLTTPSPFVLT
jgi:hypothetical protein